MKLRKITLKFFTCPAKLIIGRTLEIWQLDVLVMKIIYIKKIVSSNLIFTPILKLMYFIHWSTLFLCLCIICKKWEVTPRQKAVTSTLSIFGCWSPFYKIVIVTPVYNLVIRLSHMAIAYSNVTVLLFIYFDRNKQTKS